MVSYFFLPLGCGLPFSRLGLAHNQIGKSVISWKNIKKVPCLFLPSSRNLFDHLGWINLLQIGYHEYSYWWMYRSYGNPSFTPGEASLIYGGMFVYLCTQKYRGSFKTFAFDYANILACLVALTFLLKSATAMSPP